VRPDLESKLGLTTTDDAAAYLAALNRCFPGWGGAEKFTWALTRPGAALSPDVIQLELGGRTIAGSGINYRRVRLRTGRVLTAGIMTASWTLPESRGLGAFTRLIRESRALAARRGAALLLAFVTDTNASLRRLRAGGAALFPSTYSRWSCPGHQSRAELVHMPVQPELFTTPSTNRTSSFIYEPTEWLGQFLHRPGPVECLGIPDRWVALVEDAHPFDRVLSLVAGSRSEEIDALQALAIHATRRGRELFWFSTSESENDPTLFKAAAPQRTPGYVAVLAADANVGAIDSTELANPSADSYLGPWRLEHGDRM
jgi:hypothetical protein